MPRIYRILSTKSSLGGGSWTGDSVAVGGGFLSYWIPDVSTFSFFADSTTGYLRDGLAYANGPGTTPVYAKYWQYGSRVYFYGLNENYVRLPVPFQTSDEYGPADVTPMIHKEYVGTLP